MAAEIAAERAGALIQGLSDANEAVIRNLVSLALVRGWTDATLEAKIKRVVGLDERYARAVQNYTDSLLNQGIPPGTADRRATAYANRLRKYRAHLIARTEVQQALMDAQRMVWRRRQSEGDLSQYAVRVTRIHRDEVLCNRCRAENGKRRSLKSDEGPPFHPNCRCWEDLVDEGVTKISPESRVTYVMAPIMRLGKRRHPRKCKCVECMNQGVMKTWPALETKIVEKHLPGLHDQKTHGRKSGFAKVVESWLEGEATTQTGVRQSFALGLLDMGRLYPAVAANIRAVEVEHSGYPGVTNYGPDGHVVKFNPSEIRDVAMRRQDQLDAGHMSEGWTVGDRQALTRKMGLYDANLLAYTIAVHEFGHVAHAHWVASKNHPSSTVAFEEMSDVTDADHHIPVVSQYGGENIHERFAEWFSTVHFGLAEKETTKGFEESVVNALRKEVRFARGDVIVKSWPEINDSFEGSVVWEIVDKLRPYYEPGGTVNP